MADQVVLYKYEFSAVDQEALYLEKRALKLCWHEIDRIPAVAIILDRGLEIAKGTVPVMLHDFILAKVSELDFKVVFYLEFGGECYNCGEE